MRAFSQSVNDGRNGWTPRQSALRVSRTIAEAARHIPFYRELWGGRGVLGAAEKGNVELTDLPVLTKYKLRDGFDLLRHPTFAARGVQVRTTGGSTGEPVRFSQQRGYIERATGRGLRSLTWGGWILAERTAMVWGGPNEVQLAGGIWGWAKAVVTNRRVFDAFRTGADVYRAWVEEWERWRPRFVIGYASALDGVASYVLDAGTTIKGVATVFSTAEKLYSHQRARIEQAFGCPVRDQYGSREVLAIAAECTRGSMHAYLDSAFVELVPHDGSSAIAVTQLDNPAMPLIRYLNGDLAEWRQSRAPCECGLLYPVLHQIVGRSSDLFRLPGGRIVHGEFFTHIMYDVRDVVAFQFYQGRDGNIVLFVVLTPSAHRENAERTLKSLLQKLPNQLSVNVSVELRIVPKIPRRGQGKHRFTISELTGDG